MGDVLLTKRIEFSASHRYHNAQWDAERNRRVFGACNNPSGHGHNYLLEVTVAGPVSPDTGMVVNLYDLKQTLKDVLAEFDHKHLNLDTPYFRDRIPTTEHIAGVLWNALAKQSGIGTLHMVRLFEDEDLYAEVAARDLDAHAELLSATLVRRYQVVVPPRYRHEIEVAVAGPVSRETGMVTDLTMLDRTVDEQVLAADRPRDTGERFARWIWSRLENRVPGGRLARVRVIETRDVAYEVSAA